MGALIALGAYGGKYLDKEYSLDKAWFTMLGTLIGLAAGLYMVLKTLNSKS
jgi:F0F1-type ATP synthase assembly protein I